jgi:PPOX class probable F420-dependent enzyme
MLDDGMKQLAHGPHIAAVTTLLPDGTPMTQPVWIDADDDHLIINTETGRQKYRNISRDPRITVTIWDAAEPYRYAEARGTVVEAITGPEARAHIDELARKYTGADYANPVGTERVILKIRPDRRSGRL